VSDTTNYTCPFCGEVCIQQEHLPFGCRERVVAQRDEERQRLGGIIDAFGEMTERCYKAEEERDEAREAAAWLKQKMTHLEAACGGDRAAGTEYAWDRFHDLEKERNEARAALNLESIRVNDLLSENLALEEELVRCRAGQRALEDER
jgi:hypothetical protein